MRARILERLGQGRGQRRGDFGVEPGLAGRDRLRPAAVLIGLVAHASGYTILLTQRTDHLDVHAGQISFPGGRVEAHDRDAVATALRETEEEIGLHARHIEIVGRLDTYETGTGFSVTPVVGIVSPPFELRPDPHEVAAVFEVPLSFVLDPANHLWEEREIRGRLRRYHVLPYGEWRIWGATAGMLVNLYEAMGAE